MIYLDHAATTFIDDEVIDVITESLKTYKGNPSSTYMLGFEAVKKLNQTKTKIGTYINAKRNQLIFTASGTEANNLIIHGLYQAYKNHQFITTKIEHSSVIHTFEYLESLGAHVTYLPVNDQGFIDIKALEKALIKPTALVSIMHINNELGTQHDLKKIAEICHQHDAYFHSDCVQTLKHQALDLLEANVDFATFSAHKFHGPKGVGLVYAKDKTLLTPYMQGGSQEYRLRPGTENLAYAQGFLKALELTEKKRNDDHLICNSIVDSFINQLNERGIKYQINGPLLDGKRIKATLNIAFENIDAEGLKYYLETQEIYLSLGSACNAQSLLPSHVLSHLYDQKRVSSSVRISFGPDLSDKDIQDLVTHIHTYIKDQA